MKFLFVWTSIVTNPKFMAMPMELRGAWITLICYAAIEQPTRWQFRNRAHASLLLKRDGAEDADRLVGALINGRWLDELSDGEIEIHDSEDWQHYRSDMPDQTAERKRRSRSRAITNGHGSVTSGAKPVTTRREEKQEDERTTSSPSPRDGDGPAPVGDVVAALVENGLDAGLAAQFGARRAARTKA